jgi:alanine dehydrogenase
MILLTSKEVEKILKGKTIKKVISVVEKAFFDFGKGKVQMPPKIYLFFREFNGDLRIMPSYSENLKVAGTKIVNVHPQNQKRRLKTVMATIILNDPRTGLPLAFMDGTLITALRTGAAGAVATKYLARKKAKTLGVVGAGIQAFTQILAISKVKKLKEIVVYDIKKKAIEKLAKNLSKEGIKIKGGSLKEVCQKEIISTTTPVTKPIVKDKWILPGTHINAIGADAPGKQELESSLLKRAKIVVDAKEQAIHSGEINVPISKKIISEKNIFAELGEIVAKKKNGRKREKEITIFDSTGLAIQDLYTANLVYLQAKKKKIGREIKII